MNSDVRTLPDSVLVARILSGEKKLFEIIMEKYNKRLYRVGMAIVSDDDEVEDIMQIAYIKAYENLSSFKGHSSFLTWLTRIAINESLMWLKRQKIKVPLDENVQAAQVENRHPMNTLINHELKGLLETAIAGLPSKYRTVFMLREIEGMSTAETQECLALSEANVKVRLNRAKEMLRERLSKYVQMGDLYSFHLDRCSRVRKKVMLAIADLRDVNSFQTTDPVF